MPRKPKPPPPLHPLAHIAINLAARRAASQQLRPDVVGFDELDLAHELGAFLFGGGATARLWNAYKAVAKHILDNMVQRGELTRDKQGWYRLTPPVLEAP